MPDQYKKTVQFLFSRLPMYQRQGSVAFKKDLTNILNFSKVLKNPHLNYPSIHIAGTNGKGSVAHLLSAIFQSAGLKVGLYTSPHYRDFRERIKINGTYIPEEEVIAFVHTHRADIETIKPSFFEITVAMAFDHFSREKVDLAIIETGLGGRLDSTNILRPLISVITNIGYDHQQFLGNTLPEIAAEKAGIIKRDTPVVIGETQKETKPVFLSIAKQKESTVFFADKNYEVSTKRKDAQSQVLTVKKAGKIIFEDLTLGLTGDFQRKNLITALQTITVYNECTGNEATISAKSILKGVRDIRLLTNFFGRWQIIDNHPLTIVDSAHNREGIREALQNLQSIDYRHLHIVLGVVNDKDLAMTLPLFPKSATYYFAKANIPRGMDANLLREKAAYHGLNGRAYPSVNIAYTAAREGTGKNDLVLVTGSVFVVAEVVE